MIKRNKKGNLFSIVPAVIILLIAGIVIATAIIVNTNFYNTISGSSVQDNISKYTILNSSYGFSTMSQFLPLLGIIVVASVIFVVLMGAFGGKMGGSGR